MNGKISLEINEKFIAIPSNKLEPALSKPSIQQKMFARGR
jgi:hypothetical protein